MREFERSLVGVHYNDVNWKAQEWEWERNEKKQQKKTQKLI